MENITYKAKELLTINAKMRKTGKELGVKILNFGIPARRSASGRITCPFADSCIKFCYALKGSFF